jgi:serine/threonine protein kinase
MDHPNIAKVHDTGATENGRPYFVMDLVKGVPITKYCDEHHLTPRQRLELFIPVCQAVQHAHQKGIIHRDLKPSNVMVALYDGNPVPKIIDFGVAKATGPKLTDRTMFTALGAVIGTFEYMSPEQAELNQLDVDTRSDVYSLGVLLYELLTGTTPLDRQRLKKSALQEVLRLIREEEPPVPSTRINSHVDLPSVATNRGTEAARLSGLVRGELDWIVMKCLEKDRNRRYESASSLARDIERHLHDEPVQACPPSIPYRLKKYIRKHKAAAAFIGLLLASVAGLAVSNIQTRKNEQRAITESARAQAVSEFMRKMLSSADIDQAKGDQYTVRELLDDFSAGLGDQFADQPAAAAEIHDTIGGAYSSLHLPAKAQPHLEKAIELRQQVDGPEHEKVAKAIVTYAWILHDQQQYVEAENQLRKALEIYRRKGVTGEPVIHAMSALEKVLFTIGRDEEAKQLIDEARAIAHSTGEGYYDLATMLMRYANEQNSQGKFAEGEQLARESIDMQRSLPGQVLTGAHGLLTLSVALQSQQKYKEAEEAARESLAIFRRRYAADNPNVRRAMDQLKSVLTSRGDKPALDAIAHKEAEEASRTDSPGYHVRLAGLLLKDRPQSSAATDVAHQLIQRAIEEYGQVAVESPEDLERRLKAMEGCVGVAQLCAADPDFAPEINEAHRQFMAELAALLASFPDSARCQTEVAHGHRGWAQAVERVPNSMAQAEHHFRESIKLFEHVLRREPKQPRILKFLANNYGFLGDVLWRAGRPKEAEDAFARALEIYRVHEADIAAALSPYSTSETIGVHYRIAYFFAATNREQHATELVRNAALHVSNNTDPSALADGLYYAAVAQLRLGDIAGYRATCKALVDVPFATIVGVTKSRPVWTPCIGPGALDDPTLPVKLAEELVADKTFVEPHFALYMLGAAHYRAGQYEQAAQRLGEAISAFPAGSSPVTHSISYPRLLLAMAKWKLGQTDEARQLLAETLPEVDRELKSPASSWNRRATLEVLRNEAEGLIETEKANEAVENKNRPDNESASNSVEKATREKMREHQSPLILTNFG